MDGDGRVTVADRGLAQRHVARRSPGRGADARAARIGPARRRVPPRRGGAGGRPPVRAGRRPHHRAGHACRSTAHPALPTPTASRSRRATDPAGDPRPTPPGGRRLGRRADRHGPPHGRRVRLAAVRPVRAAQPGRPPRDRAREPAARPPRRAPRPAAVRPGAGGLPRDPRGAGRGRATSGSSRRCPTRPRSCAVPPPRAPVCGSDAATTPTRCCSGWGSDRCRGTRRCSGDRRAGSRPRSAAAIDDAGVLLDAPVALDLSAGAVVGVVGHRAAALAVARSLVAAGRDPPRSRRPRPRRRGVPRPRRRLGLGEVASPHPRPGRVRRARAPHR